MCFRWIVLLLICHVGNVYSAPCEVSALEQLHLLDCAHKLDRAAESAVNTLLDLPSKDRGAWYRIDLVAKREEQRLLEVGIPDAWQIQVYLLQNGGVQKVLDLNPTSRFSDRLIPHRYLLAPLPLVAGNATVYVFYHSHGETPLFMRLLTRQQLTNVDTVSNLLNGVIFGIMLALVLVLILGFSTQHQLSFRLYGVVVLANIFFIADIEGYPFAFIWPDAPAWNMLSPGVFVLLTIMAHIVFAVNFLRMKTGMPRLYRLHVFLFLAAFLVMVLHVIFNLDTAVNILMILYPVLACFCAFQAIRQEVVAARFYFFGTLLLIFFPVMLLVCTSLRVDPFPFIPLLAFPKLGYLGETILFGSAVVSQMRQFNWHQTEERKHRLTETEQLLKAERDKLAALEKASEHQLQLASVSHDIAQPLASLRFAITALGQMHPPGPLNEHIDQTLQYAQSLLKDLIDQTRQNQLTAEQIELGTMFTQLGQAFRDAAAHKGLNLSIHQSSLRFLGSYLILYRILTNLLANAVRYTSKGRIILGARRRPEGIEILLFDTGPGIPKHIEQNLLRAFQQGANASSDGFGLGLYIVKNLCHQCGYQLRINSRPGHASCVAVFIPDARFD